MAKISMYQVSVPVYTRMLTNLGAILDKAAAYAEAKKIEPSVLLNSRLYPDMLPLARQVQIASDHAKGSTARLAGVEPPRFEDNEKTFPELQERIRKTLDALKTVTPEQFEGAEDRTVTLPTRNGTMTLEGQQYLLHYALPNFYFHVTTAYDILRHNGLDIGKRDFLGRS